MQLMRRRKMVVEKPVEVKPHTGKGFGGRPNLDEVDPIQRDKDEFVPRGLTMSSARDRDESTRTLRTYGDLDIDTEELEKKMRPRLDQMRELLLSLTFGEKMEMSEGVSKFQKTDAFSLAMCLHRWAKGETPVEDLPAMNHHKNEEPGQ